MTSKELEITIERMGVTGIAMARWLDVRPGTINRWRHGKVPIPGPAALAIKALATGWRP